MAQNFIDIAKWKADRRARTESGVTSSEFVALLELVEAKSDRHYDAMKVIDKLDKDGLSCRACKKLKTMYENGETFAKIMTKCIRYCSYSGLMCALYECGYSDFANGMKFIASGRNLLVDAKEDIVSKIDGNHSSVLNFYLSLKQNINNATFLDSKKFIHMKIQQFSNELKRLNPESTRRRFCLLDKLLVVYCLSLEVITDAHSRFDAINHIRKDESVRESQMYEAVLLSKEGATNALKGDFDRAGDLMFRARLNLQHFKPSWAAYYHYMSEVFLKVAELDRYPNKDTKQNLLFYGFTGLLLVRNEDEETQRFLKRIYLSFMLYGLLGLNLFLGEVNVEITEEDRTLAKTLLSEFNGLSGGMETRRDMVYAFLMAKLIEAEDLELALTYARRAETLSKAGGVLRTGEAENVTAFVTKLSNKLVSFTDKIGMHG